MRNYLASLLLLVFVGQGSARADVKTGDVLVADSELGVLVIDGTTQAVTTLVPSIGNGGTQMVAPRDIAIGPHNEIYVLDRGAGTPAVWLVDPGSGMASMVTSGGLLKSPISFAIGTDGAIYVADFGTTSSNGAVVKVDPNGGSQTVFSPGGQPYAVAVDQSGNIFVVRQPDRAIESYSSIGTFRWSKSIPLHTPALLTADQNRIVDFGISSSTGTPETYALDPNTQALTPLSMPFVQDPPEGAVFLPNGDLVVSVHAVINVVVLIHPDGTYGWRVGEYHMSPIGNPYGLAVFGVRGGTVPARSATWGQLKVLYRH